MSIKKGAPEGKETGEGEGKEDKEEEERRGGSRNYSCGSCGWLFPIYDATWKASFFPATGDGGDGRGVGDQSTINQSTNQSLRQSHLTYLMPYVMYNELSTANHRNHSYDQQISCAV